MFADLQRIINIHMVWTLDAGQRTCLEGWMIETVDERELGNCVLSVWVDDDDDDDYDDNLIKLLSPFIYFF